MIQLYTLNMLESIFYFIVWVFVPTILILTLWAVGTITGNIEDERRQRIAKAGFWGGFMLFIIVMLYQVSAFIVAGFPEHEIFGGFDIWLALMGGVIGLVSFSVGGKILSQSAVGWIILVIIFLSFYALLHYLFIRTYNELLLSMIAGLTFGVFAFFASSPATIKEFLKSQSLE
ncbi:MAG: hypothetical protein UX23_C0008G0004 [Parcubacteria group bacterium GW2011_GWB1_45_9]|nr:MAG: hypothetical protein UX23_C0008G0004 [Parcubacteria group bacterium GW2011_GWB1_45_9]